MAPGQGEAAARDLRERATKLLSLDYFAALDVTRTATPDEVKKAFIEAVKAWHPDRVPPGLEEVKPLFGKVFARLELARATVSDPERRARYIADLARPTTAATANDLSSAEAALEHRKAEGLLKKNDTVNAEQHLRRAVGLAPDNVDYAILLAWLQAKPDAPPARLGELVAELDRLLAREPKAARGYFYRGQLHKRLDRMEQAMEDFARAAELDPKNVDAVREVRIFKMRQERSGRGAAASRETEAAGPLGFFKKLFKR